MFLNIAKNVNPKEYNNTEDFLKAKFGDSITNLYKDFYYFDFGTSVDQSENGFNPSLMAQKEMFGARTVLCDWYTLNLENQLSA